MILHITPEQRRYIYSAADLGRGKYPGLRRGDSIRLDCEVCVVGSGPGGSVAAHELAVAGRHVVLVERGPYLDHRDFNYKYLRMAGKLNGLRVARGYRMILHQGHGLGGASIHWVGVAARPGSDVWKEWDEIAGLNATMMEPHFQAVASIMDVTAQSRELENPNNAVVRRMAEVLGLKDHLRNAYRYTPACSGVGLCTLGCGMNQKHTMATSFLPRALATGNLQIITDCEVKRIQLQDSKRPIVARGIQGELIDFMTGRRWGRIDIRARAVVVAAGTYASSVLLLRSGKMNEKFQPGTNIHLQPHFQIYAEMPDPISSLPEKPEEIPFYGVPSIYQFEGLLEERGYSWHSSSLMPANFASFISNLPPDDHREAMRKFTHMASITFTLKDQPLRSRIIDNRNNDFEYQESRRDVERIKEASLMAGHSLFLIGARRLFLPFRKAIPVCRERDLKQIVELDVTFNDLILYSDQLNGGNSMAHDPRRGLVDVQGKVHFSENLYVADGSIFPTPIGVGPSWTIMALARHIGQQIALVLP